MNSSRVNEIFMEEVCLNEFEKKCSPCLANGDGCTNINICSVNDIVPTDNIDWLIQLEIVTREKIIGWILFDNNFPHIQISQDVPCEVSWGGVRSDVAEYFSRNGQAYSFEVNFSKSLTAWELNDLSLVISGIGSSNSSLPIFVRYPLPMGNIDDDLWFYEFSFAVKMMRIFNQESLPECKARHSQVDYEISLREYLNDSYQSEQNPHQLFDVKYYLKINPDVAKKNIHPLIHYVCYGYDEDRPTTPYINWKFYRNKYKDLIQSGISVLHHYIALGRECNLTPVDWLDGKAVNEIANIELSSYPVISYLERTYMHVLPNFYFRTPFVEDIPVLSQVHSNFPLDIIMPFYKEPHLIYLQIINFKNLAKRLSEFDIRLIFILDSPEDMLAVEQFERLLSELNVLYDLISIVNDKNLGFVLSVNKGLILSRKANRSALLLNSDAFLTPGCVNEMISVALLDHMVGFVSPRSNNASICTFPIDHCDWSTYVFKFEMLHQKLPRISYVPTAVGFCLLIKNYIIKEFGFLDYTFGDGYNEENDYILRANRLGYRAVLANHAFAFHIRGQSFRHKDCCESDNLDVLTKRYPEFLPELERYFNSREHFIDQLISGMCNYNGSLKLLIDVSNLGPYNSGTSYLAINLLKSILKIDHKLEITVYISEAALDYHKAIKDMNVKTVSSLKCDNKDCEYFAMAIRIGQPFKVRDLAEVASCSYIYLCLMLDTISLDCKYTWTTEKENTWNLLHEIADGIVYTTNFVSDQFNLRYAAHREVKSIVSYHSLEVSEYSLPESSSDKHFALKPKKILHGKKFIFIVGNHFKHKDVYNAYLSLTSIDRGLDIVILGDETMKPAQNHLATHIFPAGQVSANDLTYLYDHAFVIVYPTHYEGFGFPFLHAARSKRPLVCRDMPISREICSKLDINPTYYTSTDDLPSAVLKILDGNFDINFNTSHFPHTWQRSAQEIFEFAQKCFSTQSLRQLGHKHFILSQFPCA